MAPIELFNLQEGFRLLAEENISPDVYNFMVKMSYNIAGILKISKEEAFIKYTPIFRVLVGKKLKTDEEVSAYLSLAAQIMSEGWYDTPVWNPSTWEKHWAQNLTEANIQENEYSVRIGRTEIVYYPRNNAIARHLVGIWGSNPLSWESAIYRMQEMKLLLRRCRTKFPHATKFVSKTWLNSVPKLVPWYDMYDSYGQVSGINPFKDDNDDWQSMSSWWQIIKSDGSLRVWVVQRMLNDITNVRSKSQLNRFFPTPSAQGELPIQYVYSYFWL